MHLSSILTSYRLVRCLVNFEFLRLVGYFAHVPFIVVQGFTQLFRRQNAATLDRKLLSRLGWVKVAPGRSHVSCEILQNSTGDLLDPHRLY